VYNVPYHKWPGQNVLGKIWMSLCKNSWLLVKPGFL
jgi:hypothetical protein